MDLIDAIGAEFSDGVDYVIQWTCLEKIHREKHTYIERS